MTRWCLMAFAGLGLFAWASCSNERETRAAAGSPILVCAGIPPIAGFAERIGGEHVRVQSLLAPGQSPHTFEPTPKVIADVSSARLLFEIGLPFERTIVSKIGNAEKRLEIVDASAGIKPRMLTAREGCEADDHAHHDHAHAGDAAHSHGAGELDPHVWMDPGNAITIARTICDALITADPAHKAEFSANRDALCAELASLNDEIQKMLAAFAGRSFYVFHPAYGYFAQAYDLQQVAIESGGQQPAARELQALVEQAKADRISVLLVQPQYGKRMAATIADEIGATVVTADPLAKDYIPNMRNLAEAVRRGMATANAAVEKTPAMAASNGVAETP